jgi:hypothetical protein
VNQAILAWSVNILCQANAKSRPSHTHISNHLEKLGSPKIVGVYYYITLLTHFKASLFSIHWFTLHFSADQANIA